MEQYYNEDENSDGDYNKNNKHKYLSYKNLSNLRDNISLSTITNKNMRLFIKFCLDSIEINKLDVCGCEYECDKNIEKIYSHFVFNFLPFEHYKNREDVMINSNVYMKLLYNIIDKIYDKMLISHKLEFFKRIYILSKYKRKGYENITYSIIQIKLVDKMKQKLIKSNDYLNKKIINKLDELIQEKENKKIYEDIKKYLST